MLIELTPEMILAIQVGLDELQNTGMWADCLSKTEVKQVEIGMGQLKKVVYEN